MNNKNNKIHSNPALVDLYVNDPLTNEIYCDQKENRS
jgi:hypothetical protein